MKIQKIASRFGLLTFIVAFSACVGSTQNGSTPSLATSTTPVTVIMTAKSATSPQVISSTNTPTSPITLMGVVPTLPVEDARQRLLALLANNGDCRLPCLWEITPGKSSYLFARSILLPLHGIAETAYFDFTSSLVDDISPIYIEDDLRLKARLAYVYDNNGVVNYIIFQAVEQKLGKDQYGNQTAANVFDSDIFAKRVEYYSLSRVLSEQGIPDSVFIYIPRVEGQPIVAGIMEAVLIYPEQGIWVKYTIPMYSKGDIEAGCPANAHIEMTLAPSGNPDNFYMLLDQTDWHQTKGGFKSIEEATSMSIAEFYETFRNPTNKCIETPINIWPTPEQ